MLFYTVTVTICFFLQRTTLFRGFTKLMTAQVHNNKTPKTAKDNYSISTFCQRLPTKNKKTMKILKFKD